MDLALFFVLPLIGGFAFVTRFLLLRYRTGREEAQRLYYRAALCGVFLAIAAACLHEAVRASNADYAAFVSRVANKVLLPLLEKERTAGATPVSNAASAVRVEIAVVCVYAFLLGALTPLWNALLRGSDRAWLMWAPARWRHSVLDGFNVRAITDQLELLLAQSLFSAALIQVSLSNSKVYVGSVLKSPDAGSPAKYFKIQPWMSGYRADDGTVEFNTFYDEILAEFEKDHSRQQAVETFQLVIPIDKVVTASGFDVKSYERFLAKRAAEAAAEAVNVVCCPALGSPQAADKTGVLISQTDRQQGARHHQCGTQCGSKGGA